MENRFIEKTFAIEAEKHIDGKLTFCFDTKHNIISITKENLYEIRGVGLDAEQAKQLKDWITEVVR